MCEEDDDDFVQLWSKAWRYEDVLHDDEVLWLPPTMPAGWTPLTMVETWGGVKECKRGEAKSIGIALVHKDSDIVAKKTRSNQWGTVFESLVFKALLAAPLLSCSRGDTFRVARAAPSGE